jgi:hypothetical protein
MDATTSRALLETGEMAAFLILLALATASSAAPLEGYEKLTCGSVVKLTNKALDMRLHRYL